MSDDQFDKLFKYMERRFRSVDNRFEAMDKKFNSMIGLLDASAKRMEIFEHELLALGHISDRHQKWHYQTAKDIGIKLKV